MFNIIEGRMKIPDKFPSMMDNIDVDKLKELVSFSSIFAL